MKTLKNVPLSHLIGQSVTSLYSSSGSTFVVFSDGDSISVYANTLRIYNRKGGRVGFTELVHQTVVDATANEDGFITLKFERGFKMEISADELPYESYVLFIDGLTYAV